MTETIAGRYQIVRRLGSGGMATVYLAHDPMLGRDVAIKVPRLDAEAEPDVLERFEAELRAVGRLNHRNIVTIYDGGEDRGQPFLVMEPVDGESLAQLIRRESPLPQEQAVELAVQIADALAYAHAQGLIHRDVKPQNVLLDRAGRAKVTDFGIARSSDVTRTLAGTVMGTPNYMAPEVGAGGRATAQSDVYSLGVVLYQMLTGHTPFEAENPIAAAVRAQREDPPPPSRYVALPGWLEAVVLKAVAREPLDRYASAADLAEDLSARRAPSVAAKRPAREDLEATRAYAAVGAAPSPNAARKTTVEVVRPARRGWLPWWRISWGLPVLVAIGAIVGIIVAVLQTPGHGGGAAPAGATATAAPVQGGSNALTNGGLLPNGAQPPSGWKLQTFQGTPPRWYFQPGGPNGGDHEVAISSTSGTDTAWVGSDVALKAGAKATLSGYIKTQDVPADGPGAVLRLACAGEGGKQTGEATSAPVRGNAGWQQVQATFTIPAGTTGCTPQLRLGDSGKPTAGTAEFSHISLVSS
ncbi:MAG TPA: protein kinase [Chloroflexota bacterium]|nr:protein kinase [Chloroflexota bacterium]